MKCTNCGKEFSDEWSFCPVCGTKVEKAEEPAANSEKAEEKTEAAKQEAIADKPKAAAPQDKPKQEGRLNGYSPDFDKFGGGVVVKEKRSKLLAGVDLKFLSLALLAAIFFIFFGVNAYLNNKTAEVVFADFSVELPLSFKEVDDDTLTVSGYTECRSYSSNTLEFVYVKYNGYNLYPDALDQGMMGDFDTYSDYLDAQSAIKNLDREMLTRMDSVFKQQLVRYSSRGVVNNRLEFTYYDDNSKANYVQARTYLKDQNVYVIMCMCSENNADRFENKIDRIFGSVNFD